ncbi:MAG: ABC transporter ATP-binding protein, partial [Candidatus Hydrogenedentales bacterium]
MQADGESERMIKAEGLTMLYGPVVALKDVSFDVRQGEVVGLLGPNGAGKSTTMKILTTYLHPTEGTAQVNGIDVLEHPLEVRKHIGYLPETLPLYMDMEVRSYLQFVGRARGLGGAHLRERTDRVVEEVGLQPMYRKVVRELSKG